MELFDTHCHAHWPDFGIDTKTVINNAKKAGVTRLICVGTDYTDSLTAIEFAQMHKNIWASAGIHPHEAKKSLKNIKSLAKLIKKPKVIAIGECGLDYFYDYSPREVQKEVLEYQLQLASSTSLPVIFHIRDAYSDFWPIIDNFKGIKGVFHCFSASNKELAEILKRDFYIGLNGIFTFSKNKAQIEAFKAVPLNKMLLETDAPFLTPVPFRGTINESKNVREIAVFLSQLRGEPIKEISSKTTANALKLFRINDGL